MKLPATNKLSDTIAAYRSMLAPLYEKAEIDSVLALLCGYYFNWNRAEMLMRREDPLSESELLKLHFALKELISGKPVQYVTGEAFFYGLKLHVNGSVLIPRPETEELVQQVLNDFSAEETLLLVDAFTGSGCIPLAVKSKRKNWEVLGFDISMPALEVAKKNAVSTGVYVDFFGADIHHFPTDKFARKPDVITANPPYILPSESAKMHVNVLDFEPQIALFVPDQNPMHFYLPLLQFAVGNLRSGGRLYTEINEAYGSVVAGLLTDHGFCEVVVHRDLQDKHRFVSGILP